MKIGDKYYTGVEVQKKLNMTEPQIRNLVNQKRIKKIIPPGRKYGLYLKTEIDRFAEKWEAFLMAKEPPRTVFKVATLEDIPAQHDLDSRAIGPNGMPPEVIKSWYEVNGESDYHVYHDDKLVAFIWLVPIRHEIIGDFMQNRIHWKDIDPKRDIEPYKPGKPLDLFVQCIASDPDVDETTRMHYMLVLLRGTAEELRKLGRHGILINKVYARSQTPTGIAMALHVGMEEYQSMPKTGKLIRFELDIAKSNTFLAQAYKEGIAEWREAHQVSANSNRRQKKL